MKHARLPMQILSFKTANKLGGIFKGLCLRISKYVPGLKYDLIKADYELSRTEYVCYSLTNSILIGMIAFTLFFPLSLGIAQRTLSASLQTGLLASLILFSLFFIIYLKYPAIIANKISDELDQNLVYGLKDLLLQISSGITLDQAIANIADSGYGQISKEFEKLTKDVRSGAPMTDALEKMALKSNSRYLKRTVWQMINSIRAGSNIKGALKTVIDELITEQQNSIKNYAKELNLWTLLYMVFAVAIPSIGGTLLIILSSFADAGLNKSSFILFLVAGFLVQVALIEFIKSRRPMINI